MRQFIIDTDTASDDAVALVMALQHPEIEVKAITVVAGNVPLDQAVQNALYTVELCGSQVPVYLGRAAPILRSLETAQQVHGTDGMGDLGLPLQGRTPASEHAVDVLLRLINAAPGEITLVTLGPLSNIAVALLRDPGIAEKVAHCVIMGGASDAYGNISEVAEYNFWTDPEAAKIVLESGMPITLVGWDISRRYAVLNAAEAHAMRAIGTPLATFCIDIQASVGAWTENHTQLEGFDLPDPITMAVALDPQVATERARVAATVETSDGLCRGQLILDYRNIRHRPQTVEVVLSADRERFLTLLRAAVGHSDSKEKL